MNSIAAIALGSNLGDRAGNLVAAAKCLADLGTIRALSKLYETAPMYVTDQPAFLNAALTLETALEPLELIRSLLKLEEELGRRRALRFGPRTIDLDLIALGTHLMESDELVLPHPRLEERPFVLFPLLDVFPDWVHPRSHAPLCELVAPHVAPPTTLDPRWSRFGQTRTANAVS